MMENPGGLRQWAEGSGRQWAEGRRQKQCSVFSVQCSVFTVVPYLPFFSSIFRLCPIRRACPTLLHAALFGLPLPREIEPTSISNLCSSFLKGRRHPGT